MTNTCNTSPLPTNPPIGQNICDDHNLQWQYNNYWKNKGTTETTPTVTEANDGLVTPEIKQQIEKLKTALTTTPNFKLLNAQDSYWVYLKSQDKLLTIAPEGINQIRIEANKPKITNYLQAIACPGPTGNRGPDGIKGRAGKPAPKEECYQPIINGAELYFNIFVPISIKAGDPCYNQPTTPPINIRLHQINGPVETGLDQLHYWQLQTKYLNTTHRAALAKLQEQTIKTALGITTTPINKLQKTFSSTDISTTPIIIIQTNPDGNGTNGPIITNTDPNIDTTTTAATIIYNPETSTITGSIILKTGAWTGNWCIKARQQGLKGQTGENGDQLIKITECTINDTIIRATEPIVNVRMDCLTNSLYISSTVELTKHCAKYLAPASDSANTTANTKPGTATYAAVTPTGINCKPIVYYKPTPILNEERNPNYYHWKPMPGCLSSHHYDKQSFNWIPDTTTEPCELLSRWFDTNMQAKPGTYPHQIHTATSPNTTCCQEDFFYCPNIQNGGCPPVQTVNQTP